MRPSPGSARRHQPTSRGTAIFRERLPRAYELLVDNGGYDFNLVKYLLSMQPEATVEPEDDRFDLLTGRRSTLEWSVSTAADERPGITVRRGEAIAGFLTEGQPFGGVPYVEELRAAGAVHELIDAVQDLGDKPDPVSPSGRVLTKNSQFGKSIDGIHRWYGHWYGYEEGHRHSR